MLKAVTAHMEENPVRADLAACHTVHMDQQDPAIGAAKRIHLSSDERDAMHQNLLAFMQNNPVRIKRGEEPGQSLRDKVLSYLLPLHSMPAFALALLLLIGAGGGISYAAESALPGDVLYPVKVSINEEVRANLQGSAHAKAQWEGERAQRRLREAEKLVALGRLNKELREELTAYFNTHVTSSSEAMTEAAVMDTDAAADLQTDIEGDLQAHAMVLQLLARQTDDAREEIRTLLQEVRAAAANIAKTDVHAEGDADVAADTSIGISNMIDAAEHKIGEVKTFIERKKTNSTAEATATAEARLELAEQQLMEAQLDLATDATTEAKANVKNARRAAQEAKIILQTESDLGIRLGNNEDDDEGEDSTSSQSSSTSSTSISASSASSDDDDKKVKMDLDANAGADVNVNTNGNGSVNVDVKSTAGIKTGL